MDAKTPPNPYVWQRHSFTGQRWPKSRVARSFLLMVPWINLMAMAVLIYCLARQTIVQPGHVVELPKGAVAEGMPAHCPTAIVRCLTVPNRGQFSVLLLDEGRYSSDNTGELAALKRLKLPAEINLVMDTHVSYGEAMEWVERLKACGAERVNLVTELQSQEER